MDMDTYTTDFDNNISETDIYQIYEDGGKELDTLPAEHLYVLRETAFNQANIGIIVKAISNLGRPFITMNTDVADVRKAYDALISNEGLYSRMCARAIKMMDASMENMKRAEEKLVSYLKTEEEKDKEISKRARGREYDEYDPRGFENLRYEVDELKHQISDNFINTLLRRRVFAEYEGELLVEDSGSGVL
jgi:hypothetical protein